MARRESGAVLLTVVLMLAVLTAIAFSLNRGAGMAMRSVSTDYERHKAAYLAEAALALSRWKNASHPCGSAGISAQAFAGGTLNATVTKSGAGQIDVVATGTTASGALATLTRNNVWLPDFTAQQTKNAGGIRDTTITSGVTTSQKGGKTLILTSGQSKALMSWPLGEVPGGGQVLSATLTLTQNGIGVLPRTVNVQRLLNVWDDSATWTQARANVPWTGGNYTSTPAASASVGALPSYQFNITGLVDSWVNGILPNDGLLLVLPDAGQSATFNSQEAGGVLVPVLSLTFVPHC